MYEQYYLAFTIFWTVIGALLLHMQFVALKRGTTFFYKPILKEKQPKAFWLVQFFWLTLTLGCFSLLIDWLIFY